MKRIIKNPGLSRHARALGVSAGHLSQVVEGERSSPKLRARYLALIAAERANEEGAKIRVLPPGTVFKDVPSMQAKSAEATFGADVRQAIGPASGKGSESNLVLEKSFILVTSGEENTLSPLAEDAPAEAQHEPELTPAG